MNRVLYSNKDDPRIFVYRDENIEYGVTLNFAHRKAWAMMISWFVLAIVPIALVWFFKAGFLAVVLFALFDVSLGVSVVIISIKGAAQDFKKYPGLKGPRARLS